MAKTPWDAKYRPKSLKKFIFQDKNHKMVVDKIIEEGAFQHLLLSGHAGTGKTSLAYLLRDLLEIDENDFLKINASDENNVETVRNKIKGFVSTYPTSAFKIVLLDEADYLTPAAQGILRGTMDEYVDNARFILTCNFPHKIIEPLRSRCQELSFKSLDKDQMVAKMVEILMAEKIPVEDDEIDMLYTYADAAYPDFRKLIGTVEQNVSNGKLRPMTGEISKSTELCFEILQMIEQDDWDAARKFACTNVSDDQWEEVYRFLYDCLDDAGKFKDQAKWKQGIIVIADHLYRHSFVADHEINFAACAVKLSLI